MVTISIFEMEYILRRISILGYLQMWENKGGLRCLLIRKTYKLQMIQ